MHRSTLSHFTGHVDIAESHDLILGDNVIRDSRSLNFEVLNLLFLHDFSQGPLPELISEGSWVLSVHRLHPIPLTFVSGEARDALWGPMNLNFRQTSPRLVLVGLPAICGATQMWT